MNQANSVFQAFEQIAGTNADQPFLLAPAVATRAWAEGPVLWSYGAADQRVRQLAHGYQLLGIGPGDRVSLAYDSRPDVYLHLLAVNALGASLVPLNLAATDDEIRFVISHSESALVVGAGEHLPRLQQLLQGKSALPVHAGAALVNAGAAMVNAGAAMVNAGAAPVNAGAALVNAGAALAQGNDGPALSAAPAATASEAALLYTSGTTGKPKGCMLSNQYFLTMGQWYNQLDGYCRLQAGDRLLTPLPPNHMNALCTSFMGMLMCGGCVIQLDRFHPRSWWQTVRDSGATVVHYLGVMPAILLTLPESATENFAGQVRFGFGAGSDPRHQAVFEQRFGFPLIEAWAMTETGAGAVTIADHEPRHLGQRCIGKPAAGMAFRLVDENDAEVASGEPGELLVRRTGADAGHGFFSGYFRDPEATDEGWRGGWWHTGDVVRADAEGSLFFVDRRKNVIRRSGENIAAVEVETALLSCEGVANCAVTAVPDEIRGDEVFAMVVVADGTGANQQTARRIFDHCMTRLSYFKTPGYLSFVDALPLTGSQKVKRAEVQQLARDQLKAGSCHDLRTRKTRPAAP